MPLIKWRFGIYKKAGKYGLCVFSTPEATEPSAYCGLLFNTLAAALRAAEEQNLAYDNGHILPALYKTPH